MHIITTLLCDYGDITYPMDELIEQISNAKFEDAPLLLGRLYRHRGLYPEAEKILEEYLRECDGHRKESMRKLLAMYSQQKDELGHSIIY